MAITRVWPETSRTVVPQQTFNVLLLGQGYTAKEFVPVAEQLRKNVFTVAPFDLVPSLGLPAAGSAMALYCDAGGAADLRVKQAGNVLSIDAPDADRLRSYIAGLAIPDVGGQVPGRSLWPAGGRFGPFGGLVVAVVKGNTKGELYQVEATGRYPVPLVAVVAVTGEPWENVVVRAIAQTYGGLADEYELSGPEFAAAPEGLMAVGKNVIGITAAQRTRLVAGEAPSTVVQVPDYWPHKSDPSVVFMKHPNPATANAPHPVTTGRVLVEGGAGYRTNVLRGAADCLMRRKPNDPAIPIQDVVGLCVVCRSALTMMLRGKLSVVPETPTYLGTQKLLYDRVAWGRVVTPKPSPLPFRTTIDPDPATKPVWAGQVEVNAARGLTISGLKLLERPGDPFSTGTAGSADDVLKSVTFEDIKITFGSSETAFDFAQAMANTKRPPVLQIGYDGGAKKEFRYGIKLTCTWEPQGKWAVEVAMSLVLKGEANDFDPGGAAVACKLYPQLSVRYRRPSKGAASTGSYPKIPKLTGTVAFTFANHIPSTLTGLPTALSHMASGRHGVALVTDSNSSSWDSDYTLNKAATVNIGAFFMGAPTTFEGFWQSGRKLAGVRDSDPLAFDMAHTASTVAGATARWMHLNRSGPPLPYWSWLFDFVTPDVTANSHFTAVYRLGDMTPSGAHDGGKPRSAKHSWPLVADQIGTSDAYEMTVLKVGRQGAYDNIHASADMGTDSHGRQVVAAPFCADTCMHLHWRWGLVAVSALTYDKGLIQFLGWGDGHHGQGANSVRGAVLIPPNQKLEIDATRVSNAETNVRYIVEVRDPGFDEPQVILEQGMGFAYTYGGLATDDLALLSVGVLAHPPNLVDDLKSNLKTLKAGPVSAFDAFVRELFMKIYARIRWFDETHDLVKKTTQQLPSTAATLKALEDL